MWFSWKWRALHDTFLETMSFWGGQLWSMDTSTMIGSEICLPMKWFGGGTLSHFTPRDMWDAGKYVRVRRRPRFESLVIDFFLHLLYMQHIGRTQVSYQALLILIKSDERRRSEIRITHQWTLNCQPLSMCHRREAFMLPWKITTVNCDWRNFVKITANHRVPWTTETF